MPAAASGDNVASMKSFALKAEALRGTQAPLQKVLRGEFQEHQVQVFAPLSYSQTDDPDIAAAYLTVEWIS